MWRALRIACVGCPDTELRKIEAMLARLGLQEQIDSLSADEDTVLRHKDNPYDIVFFAGNFTVAEHAQVIARLREATRDTFSLLSAARRALQKRRPFSTTRGSTGFCRTTIPKMKSRKPSSMQLNG